MKFKKIYLEITNTCNLNCAFCIKDDRNKQNISKEKFTYLLEECKKYTKFIYLHLKGEPFFHPEFKELLEITENYNYKVNVTTNGIILLNNFEHLECKSINQINISMQSWGQLPEKKRLELFGKLNELVKINNEKYHKYLFLRIWNDKEKNKDFNKEIETFLEKFNVKEIKTQKISDYLFLSIDDEFEWPSLSNEFYGENGRCLGGIDHIGVLVDGTVVLCCLDSFGVTNLGNIYDSSLEEILQTDKYKTIKTSMKNGKMCEKLCMHCSYKNRFE